jgi:hypothetical protein
LGPGAEAGAEIGGFGAEAGEAWESGHRRIWREERRKGNRGLTRMGADFSIRGATVKYEKG